MSTLRIGDPTRIDGTFYLDGFLADPTTVYLLVTKPSGVELEFVWPSPGVGQGSLVKDALGTFHADLAGASVDESGTWQVHWEADGAVVTTIDSNFLVSPLLQPFRVRVRDGALSPISDVRVEIYDVHESLVGSGTTDVNGYIPYTRVEPGAFTVYCSKRKVTFSPLTATVVANLGSQTANVTGVVLAVADPGAVPQARLFGYTLPDVSVFVEVPKAQNIATGSGTGVEPKNFFIPPSRHHLLSGSQGFWEIDVPIGVTVRVRIPAGNIDKIFRIPEDANVLNFRDARPDPGPGNELGIVADTPTRESLKGFG